MFTGIIETQGVIKAIDKNPDNFSVEIEIPKDKESFLEDCHIGDSISCGGICLTVISFTSNSFRVGISQETLRRTNIEKMWQSIPNAHVNLERAMGHGNTRFGGHYVQGHIDTVATIISKESEGDSINYGFELRDPEYEQYIVEKGFITIDGASLTVTKIEGPKFWISMIKHTQGILCPREIGDLVNIEVDLTGKLISKQVKLYLGKHLNK
ncbi:riboflavin synthase SCDLUD_002472 [Saccharomycodes ludwigii]|uniref:riboflavin synthase n=1 Tax=Saccharomycodes ludwigii TaxID=36035 RepID=UPI001E8ADC5C|nr:hypothetical protein SCDLUD_002472 [Saccharomycodes ludwigii]KAH3901007.1 hypothetical protein SCDLUD_002472 [Saccharomycodes ludwigii]